MWDCAASEKGKIDVAAVGIDAQFLKRQQQSNKKKIRQCCGSESYYAAGMSPPLFSPSVKFAVQNTKVSM